MTGDGYLDEASNILNEEKQHGKKERKKGFPSTFLLDSVDHLVYGFEALL